MEVFGLFVLIGIVLVGYGILLYKHPDLEWNISLARHWYLKGGELTDTYYTHQRISAVISVIAGVLMIIIGISMIGTQIRGYVVEIDGDELRIPGTYAEIQALGYNVDSSEEIRILKATDNNNKKSATYIVNNADGKEIEITFENRGQTDKPATECELVAIYVKAENGPRMKLPNGVRIGMGRDDVRGIMGKGTTSGGLSSEWYRESVNFDSYKIYIVYTDGFVNRKVESIRIEDTIY